MRSTTCVRAWSSARGTSPSYVAAPRAGERERLSIRVARGVNRALGRRGPLWSDRYHARALTSPRAVRNALVYVLANHKKHRASTATIDPCSSGAWFSGWKEELATVYALDDVRRWSNVPPPIAPAATWLASIGWLRHGPIAVDESPIAADASPSRAGSRRASRSSG